MTARVCVCLTCTCVNECLRVCACVCVYVRQVLLLSDKRCLDDKPPFNRGEGGWQRGCSGGGGGTEGEVKWECIEAILINKSK